MNVHKTIYSNLGYCLCDMYDHYFKPINALQVHIISHKQQTSYSRMRRLGIERKCNSEKEEFSYFSQQLIPYSHNTIATVKRLVIQRGRKSWFVLYLNKIFRIQIISKLIKTYYICLKNVRKMILNQFLFWSSDYGINDIYFIVLCFVSTLFR